MMPTYENYKMNDESPPRSEERFSEEFFKHVFEKENRIRQTVKSEPMSRLLHDVELWSEMVQSVWKGIYNRTPYGSLVALFLGVFYILNPFDFIPDFLPVIGQVDDISVLGFCIYLVERDMKKYQEWKMGRLADAQPAEECAIEFDR